MDLTNKIAIVAGSGNPEGIGFATAKTYVEHGATVMMIDISAEVHELAASLGDKARAFTGDVSRFRDMELIIEKIIADYGRIDIVVNNAAVNIPGDSVETPMERWELHYNVNVKSQFIMSKLVIPQMRKQGYGSIVNMASANSFVAEKQLYAYVGTKGAVRQQTMADALDNAPYGIRINCIGPGLVNTGFNDEHHDKVDGGIDEVMKHINDIHPTGKPVTVQEVANMALFLASDLSTGCIGGYYPVDGGFAIK